MMRIRLRSIFGVFARMRPRALGLSLLSLIAANGLAFAESGARSAPADPLEFRAEVRLAGDAPILEALAGDATSARAYAIRASTELRTPALALPALARISASREAFEAEAALHQAAEIIYHLEEDFIARDELDRAPFQEAAEILHTISEDEALPIGWRVRAGIAALELRDRLGP